MEEIITSGLREMGLAGRVPDDAPSRLARYGRMLLEKNQVVNLTAIREADQVARLHWTAPPCSCAPTFTGSGSSTWAPGPASPVWC